MTVLNRHDRAQAASSRLGERCNRLGISRSKWRLVRTAAQPAQRNHQYSRNSIERIAFHNSLLSGKVAQ